MLGLWGQKIQPLQGGITMDRVPYLRVVSNENNSSCVNGTPRSSAIASKSMRTRKSDGMPREIQLRTPEVERPRCSATVGTPPSRSKMSAAVVIPFNISRIGTKSNPASGRSLKVRDQPFPLRPKMGSSILCPMPKKHPYKDFGDRLRTAREALGYKKAAPFARALEFHEGSYRNYERGDRFPPLSELHRILDAGISLEWLIRGTAPALELTQVTKSRAS